MGSGFSLALGLGEAGIAMAAYLEKNSATNA